MVLFDMEDFAYHPIMIVEYRKDDKVRVLVRSHKGYVGSIMDIDEKYKRYMVFGVWYLWHEIERYSTSFPCTHPEGSSQKPDGYCEGKGYCAD